MFDSFECEDINLEGQVPGEENMRIKLAETKTN